VLNTKRERTFAAEYARASVVIGTALVLAALWLVVQRDDRLRTVLAFAVAGAPVIVRSLLNKARKA
jgi:hypothetical protein